MTATCPRDALRVAHHLDGRRVDGCDRRTAYQHRTASLRCLVVFSTWYPMGVMLLVFRVRRLGG